MTAGLSRPSRANPRGALAQAVANVGPSHKPNGLAIHGYAEDDRQIKLFIDALKTSKRRLPNRMFLEVKKVYFTEVSVQRVPWETLQNASSASAMGGSRAIGSSRRGGGLGGSRAIGSSRRGGGLGASTGRRTRGGFSGGRGSGASYPAQPGLGTYGKQIYEFTAHIEFAWIERPGTPAS